MPNECIHLHVATHQSNYKIFKNLFRHRTDTKLKDDHGSDFLEVLCFLVVDNLDWNDTEPIDVLNESRKRRSVNIPYIVPEPMVLIFQKREVHTQSVFIGRRTKATGNNEVIVSTGFLYYLSIVIWSFRNVNKKLEKITLPPLGSTLQNRMDSRTITTICPHFREAIENNEPYAKYKMNRWGCSIPDDLWIDNVSLWFLQFLITTDKLQFFLAASFLP